MKKLTLIALTVVAILAAAAFASTRLWAASPVASSTAPVTQPCGEQVLFGHVKSVTPKGDRFELQFDPAWFTSGLTASRAQLQDTGSGDVANDNYVIEEGHRLLTYIVRSNAHIIVLTRKYQGVRAVTAFNNSATPREVTVDLPTGYGDVPNDNYVVEEGHRLLTYIVPANAHITVLTKEGRLDSGGFPSTAVTPSQLAELLAGKEPVKLFEGLSTGFWMHVHVDTVCSLEQQYQP